MTGAGLWQFLLTCVELLFIGAMVFLGVDYLPVTDPNFKVIAKYAIGGVLVLYFLIAVGAVFFGIGGATVVLTPLALLILAIAIIALFVVIYIVNLIVNAFAPEPAKAIINYVVGAVAIIIMLSVAAQALSGGTLLSGSGFRLR
jgi:hypothetical protein